MRVWLVTGASRGLGSALVRTYRESGCAERVVAKPYPNPRALEIDKVTRLLVEAW
ncbi:hypothetical protein [Saccharopolyspora sp. ASAGF58]|uniref:hypothetical protein n=1 Tax=Saccharopolyspora sp. ASAGF58 TaxID=2719023 RepID=UPI001444E03F|nr:hypothetical protein [Saccharopolyspora sp. ASAGF58]